MKHSATVQAEAASQRKSSRWITLDVSSQTLTKAQTSAQVSPSSNPSVQARRLRKSLNRASKANVQKQAAGMMFVIGGVSTAITAGSALSVAQSTSSNTAPVVTNGLDAAESTILAVNQSQQPLGNTREVVNFPPVVLSERPSLVQFSSPASRDVSVAASTLVNDAQIEVGQRLNEVELKLLNLQRHLALDVYELSFIDQLLKQDQRYQNQLQNLKALDAEIALELSNATIDQSRLSQLKEQFQRDNTQLQQMAQALLENHLTVTQASKSNPTLQQEPLYQSLLSQLADYTHEHNVLLARQENVEIATVQFKKYVA